MLLHQERQASHVGIIFPCIPKGTLKDWPAQAGLGGHMMIKLSKDAFQKT